MLHFENDYNKGAHPALLKAIVDSNDQAMAGYGNDPYCQRAEEKIREACQAPAAQVYFLTGGTQTNQVAIAALLQSYEGVIAADTGHISLHEAGAIEYTGHKVLTLPHQEGKIVPADLAAYLADFYADANHEHMVFPGMVYLSHPTEYGTLYEKAELEEISEICRSYAIPLFLDGARLGYGLAARETDLDLATIAQTCQAFYIGGTKMGALCGEALVFPQGNVPKHFSTIVKQHGALLAKGRLIGVQFDAFFTDHLYKKIGEEAIRKAEMLKEILKEKGYSFYLESPTNQQFILVENENLSTLSEKIAYSFWEKYDETRTVIRLATSWSTTDEDLEALKNCL